MDQFIVGVGIGLVASGVFVAVAKRNSHAIEPGRSLLQLAARIVIAIGLAVLLASVSSLAIRVVLGLAVLGIGLASVAPLLVRAPKKAAIRLVLGLAIGLLLGLLVGLLSPSNESERDRLASVECSDCAEIRALRVVDGGVVIELADAVSNTEIHLWSQDQPSSALTIQVVEPLRVETTANQVWDIDSLKASHSGSEIFIQLDVAGGVAVSNRSERLPEEGHLNADGTTGINVPGQIAFGSLDRDGRLLWSVLTNGSLSSQYSGRRPPDRKLLPATVGADELCVETTCVSWAPGDWLDSLPGTDVVRTRGRVIGDEIVTSCFVVSGGPLAAGEWCFDETGVLSYLDDRQDGLVLELGDGS